MQALLALFLAVFFLTPAAVESQPYHYCRNSTTLPTASFLSNRNGLFSTLPSAAADSAIGFSNATAGNASPDAAYGLALCRADVASADCQTCLNGSTVDALTYCPNTTVGVFYYDECELHYSDADFFGSIANYGMIRLRNYFNYSQYPAFSNATTQLLANLSELAAFQYPRRFAVGTADPPAGLPKLYGMALCTPDLSPGDCFRCLSNYSERILNCCSIYAGAQVHAPSCFARFETYLFYNVQPAQAAMGLTLTSAATPAPAPVQQPEGGGSNETWKTVVIVVVCAGGGVILLLLAVFICMRGRRQRKEMNTLAGSKSIGQSGEINDVSLQIRLSIIRAATNNFAEENKLGAGGFGAVYKGTLDNGVEIAVKKLYGESQQGVEQMSNEVTTLVKLQQRNLVRLLGFCLEQNDKLLVYEFLCNSSLDKIIFSSEYRSERRKELNWEARFKIIEGIARGLQYLHEDSRLKIIHRDLKASNVLLDADMNPKISDFGLARILDIDDATQAETRRIAGTFGYMAPEYALHGHISTKSDVYSFGVLVLEIVTGRRNTGDDLEAAALDATDDLLTYVWRHWNKGMALALLDDCLDGDCEPEQVLLCISVGLLCVQDWPSERPSMQKVLLMLDSDSISLPKPSAPAFVVPVRRHGETDGTGFTADELMKTTASLVSNNEVTISELEPR